MTLLTPLSIGRDPISILREYSEFLKEYETKSSFVSDIWNEKEKNAFIYSVINILQLEFSWNENFNSIVFAASKITWSSHLIALTFKILRILLREPCGIELLLTDSCIIDLFYKYSFGTSPLEVQLESMKATVNILYLSATQRCHFCEEGSDKIGHMLDLIVSTESHTSEKAFLLMRYLFLISIERRGQQEIILNNGIDVVGTFMTCCTKNLEIDYANQNTTEALRVLFNLTMSGTYFDTISESSQINLFNIYSNVISLISSENIRGIHFSSNPECDYSLNGDDDGRLLSMDGFILRNACVNLLLNIPIKLQLEYSKKLIGHDTNHENAQRIFFKSKFVSLLYFISDALVLKPEAVIPVLLVLTKLCKEDYSVRSFLRHALFPSSSRIDKSQLPTHGTSLRARMISLMTSSQIDLKNAASDFIFALFKNNPTRMVFHVGYGNAAGILYQITGGDSEVAARLAVLNKPLTNDEELASSDEELMVDESSSVAVNPITGTVEYPQPSADSITGFPAALSESVPAGSDMTEEEKEAESARLLDLFDRLEKTGIVKVAIGKDEQRSEKEKENNSR